MANTLYIKAKEDFLQGNIDLANDDIKVMLIDAQDYAADTSNDEDLADIPAAARITTPVELTGKSIAGGVFDANDVTFTGVTGDEAEALVIYVDTGSEATSRLVAYIDVAISGLPITPNTGDIQVVWSEDSDKIFRI